MRQFLIVAMGVGDTMLSDNSPRRLKNTDILKKIELAIKHLAPLSSGAVNLNYPYDTNKDINVISKVFPTSKIIDVRLHGKSVLDSVNDLVIKESDNTGKVVLKGDQLDFIFRPEEYEVILLGVDLHGSMVKTIQDLLDKGYKVKLIRDAFSTFPKAMNEIREMFKHPNFEFCSYQVIKGV